MKMARGKINNPPKINLTPVNVCGPIVSIPDVWATKAVPHIIAQIKSKIVEEFWLINLIID